MWLYYSLLHTLTTSVIQIAYHILAHTGQDASVDHQSDMLLIKVTLVRMLPIALLYATYIRIIDQFVIT